MTLLYFLLYPFIAAAAVFAFGQRKPLAFALSVVPLLLQLTSKITLGMEYDTVWFSAIAVHLHLKLDHLSEIFLYITNASIPIAILASQKPARPNFFYGLILTVQGLLIGFFTSQDLVCFTFFFEGMLLPLYFLISNWGKEKSQKAAFTFILYMVAGSVLMVAAVLSLYVSAGSFDIATLASRAEKLTYATLIAGIFLLAFLVKTPLFPFHAWLPDAYCQAPLPATILLSAVLSKTGIYGILRVSMTLFPTLFTEWSSPLLLIAIAGVLYGAFAAWGQNDFKRLIAYSSFSHVNFILAGLFAANQMAVHGAILQAINHSITITGLFLVAAWLEERLGTTQFGKVSGLASHMPKLAWLTLFFVLSSVALPGLNNFVSEVMVLYGLFIQSPLLSALLGTTVVLSVIYMLRFMHQVYFETSTLRKAAWQDIKAKETVIALPLLVLILWLGIYPGPVLASIMEISK